MEIVKKFIIQFNTQIIDLSIGMRWQAFLNGVATAVVNQDDGCKIFQAGL